ncbi:hypothetical protein [Priestia megaterium]|uniref:hypothetical protein n=1 Tax=Priestia megaterium TaxID=1404 RepID=UPI001ADFB7CF|nr:hypothetical protein [Priestia megaterium]
MKTPAGTAEQMRPRRSEATRRLIGRPRKAKPCTEINSGRASSPDHASKLFVFGLDSFRSVPSSFHYDCS